MNNFLKEGVIVNEKAYIYQNPFEEEELVDKFLFQIQILPFILTHSCIYSCFFPLPGPMLRINRKSFQSANQIILHLCLKPFHGILLHLRRNQVRKHGPEAPPDLAPPCSQEGSHTTLSLSP